MSLHLARLCSLAVCGSNGTSFEDDLTLGAEGTNHLRARWGVPSCGVTVTPRAELTRRRPGSWGQAGADPEGTVPKLCIPWGSGLWPQGRTSPRVASVGPVPETPRLTPCRLSAPFSQLFCYRGATRPRAGEVWGSGGGWRGAWGYRPCASRWQHPLRSASSPPPCPQSSAGQAPQPGAQHGIQCPLQPHHQDQLQVGAGRVSEGVVGSPPS